ncbi:hypothetical protein J7I97_30520 [Streptomyces sp. ISL-87]|nr:hypothetical protein [Streptomyces sp. ISL-87]MBT2406472.1 hypothetical protein [Streptomyces sp. ISL-21]MBT2612454.1 hypothetical protein [Streptomyces sp. ISL-87]
MSLILAHGTDNAAPPKPFRRYPGTGLGGGGGDSVAGLVKTGGGTQ